MTFVPAPSHRRGFLARLSAAAAALAIPSSAVEGLPRRLDPAAPAAPGDWDNSWLEKLDVPMKQVFDVPELGEGGAYYYAKNYLNGMTQGYGYAPEQVRAVLVLHGPGLGLAMGDGLWKTFKLGERYKFTDAATKAPAERNVWLTGDTANDVLPESSLTGIQQRGAIVLACYNALNNTAGRLAKAFSREQPDVLAELKRGLAPGVIIVPAAVAAMGRAQHKGCSYVYAGG